MAHAKSLKIILSLVILQMPVLFDIQKAVKQWAMREYQRTATYRQKRLLKKELKKKKKYIGVQIDWSDVAFNDVTEWQNVTEAAFEAGDVGQEVEENVNEQRDTSRPVEGDMMQTSVLFQTRFINNTNATQEYTIKTEKTTRSTCTTSIDHSFAKGINMSVSMKSPGEIVEANAGFNSEQTLSNGAGEEFGQDLVWGVESLVRVEKGHLADAQLVVEEKKQAGDFQVTTTARGMIYVTFTNMADNNSFLKATGHELSEIVKDYVNREGRKGQGYDFVKTDDDDVVTIKTRGRCHFRYGVKQEIKVNQVALKNEKE